MHDLDRPAIRRLYTLTYTGKCARCMHNILSRLVSQFYVIYSISICCVLTSMKMGYINLVALELDI